jgi:enoyl-[acyl-carrier protein] reductase I
MTCKLLEGKKGLIFGVLNEKSIAWKVAEKSYNEGAELVLSNTAAARRLGDVDQLARTVNAEVITADATSMEDLNILLSKTMQIFGGKFDFILHSIGMSQNVRKGLSYNELNYAFFTKTLDISALSFHRVLSTAYKLDAINEWGSVVALSYIASQRTLHGYNDMGDAKALLEVIARSFGYIYGKNRNVRINTISQSPTLTTAGSGVKGMDSLMDFSQKMSPLGNATAEDCANYCITLFSDLTRKVTMQNLFHDGGFSSMGMSLEAMKHYDSIKNSK